MINTSSIKPKLSAFWVFTLSSLFFPCVYAETNESLLDKAEDTQQKLGERLTSFATKVDGYFSQQRAYDEENASWGRIRAEVSKIRDEDLEFKLRLKAKMVLPNTKRRIHLLLDNNDEDEGIAGNGALDTGIGQLTTPDSSSSRLAVRVNTVQEDRLRINYDLGLRWYESKVQLYARNRVRLSYPIGENWVGRATNRLWWYTSAGFEDELNLDFERSFGANRDKFFRATSTADWKEDEDGADLSQLFGIYKELGNNRAIAGELIGAWKTAPDPEVGEHFDGLEARLRYRRSVWRPWLFVEVWPALSWPASRDYETTVGGLIRVEGFFGDKSGWR